MVVVVERLLKCFLCVFELIFSTQSYEDPEEAAHRWGVVITSLTRFTAIALPFLSVTAEWNRVTSVAKCWLALLSPQQLLLQKSATTACMCLFPAVCAPMGRSVWAAATLLRRKAVLKLGERGENCLIEVIRNWEIWKMLLFFRELQHAAPHSDGD